MSSESGAGVAWLGEAPSWVQAVATLYGGVAALMVGGIQPLVFGSLVGAGASTSQRSAASQRSSRSAWRWAPASGRGWCAGSARAG